MSFWDTCKAAAGVAGHAAKIAGQKAKLKTEIAMVDRHVKSRKQAFGVEMYDHVSPMAESQEFYASEDTLTKTLRPPLIIAHKEILALTGKRGKVKEKINEAQVKRAGAFPTPAATFGEKVANAGKSASMAGSEAKIKTELAVVERQILAAKQQFGLDLYQIFVDLEDKDGWLPPDRDIRALYDQARRDVEKLFEKKEQKRQQLKALGGGEFSEEGTGSSQQRSSRTPVGIQADTSRRAPNVPVANVRSQSSGNSAVAQGYNGAAKLAHATSNAPLSMKNDDLLLFDYGDK